MIGQTVVNVKIGGARTRLSTVVAGLFLRARDRARRAHGRIPMVALAAVMMVVAIFDGRLAPRQAVDAAPDAAVGDARHDRHDRGHRGDRQPRDRRGTGVVLAMVLFADGWRTSSAVEREVAADGEWVGCTVTGPLFFGSSNDLVDQFWYADEPRQRSRSTSDARIWDTSTVAALDSIEKYADRRIAVRIEGLDERSTRFRRRLSGQPRLAARRGRPARLSQPAPSAPGRPAARPGIRRGPGSAPIPPSRCV